MAEKVTIDTVARHARVSRQTVSNVINSPHIVRAETRQRVEEAIALLGYRANQAARQMRTGRSKLIAVRIEPTRDGINGSVLDRFLHGLTFAAAGVGYRVMLYTAADPKDEIGTFGDLLASYDLDGFVLTGTDHGDVRTFWLAERDVPFVTFGRPWDAPERHSWVDVDNADGTAQAARRLVDSGHRRIAFIGWPTGSGVGDDRRDGWRRTMAAHDLDVTGLDRACEDSIANGEACARDLLDLPDPPTAVVCASDSLALGALQAVQAAQAVHATGPAWDGGRRDLRRGDGRAGDGGDHGAALTSADTALVSGVSVLAGGRAPAPSALTPDGRVLAVTGFDDTPVARAIGLTSVSQPLADAAARCIDLLTHHLDGNPDGTSQVLLKPSLVVRQTA